MFARPDRSTSATGWAGRTAGDPLPGPGARSRPVASAACTLADRARRGRQPALVPDHRSSDVRPASRPGPAVVGPWRPISLERRRGVGRRRPPRAERGSTATSDVSRSPRDCATSTVPRRPGPGSSSTDRPGGHAADLDLVDGDGGTRGPRRRARPGWRALVAAHARAAGPARRACRHRADGGDATSIDAGRIGFRSHRRRPDRRTRHRLTTDCDLHINGARIFARGAVWTPIDPVGFGDDRRRPAAIAGACPRRRHEHAPHPRHSGRTRSPTFHELCDELGILVWQDLMFANLDYPFVDDAFRALGRARGRRSSSIASRPRPSTAVLCGNSEVEQQVAMLGPRSGARPRRRSTP